jgi:hypothetical protein
MFEIDRFMMWIKSKAAFFSNGLILGIRASCPRSIYLHAMLNDLDQEELLM